MENTETETAQILNRCPVCTTQLTWVEVHGHYQCITCKAVISECCSGERSDNEQA